MSSDPPFGAVGRPDDHDSSGPRDLGGGVGVRVVLVPDLAGAPVRVLSVLEQLLIDLAAWEAADATDPPTARPPLRLPAPLAARGALGAVRRLAAALGPTQCPGTDRGRLLGPDGCYEHTPLTVLTLPVADIDLLAATARALGRPGLDPDVVDVLLAYASRLPAASDGCGPEGRDRLVPAVAGLAGLLDLAPTGDTQLLIARLAANPAHLDLALTDAEEAAYTATVARMATLWSAGHPLPTGRPLY